MVVLPPVHHLDVPARGAAGVERRCSSTPTIFLFLGFPGWDGYGVGDMSSPWLLAVIVAGAAVLPGPGQPAPRPGLVPALDAPVRRQLGLGDVGVRPGRRGEARRVTRSRRQDQVDQLAGIGYEPAWRGDHDAADHRLALDAQPGPRPVLGADEPARPGHRHAAPCARPSSAATRSSGSTSATVTCTTSDLIEAVQTRCRVRARRVHRRRGSSRKPIGSGRPAVQGHRRRRSASSSAGTWKVADAVAEQPWLPNGPIPLEVTWRCRATSASATAARTDGEVATA